MSAILLQQRVPTHFKPISGSFVERRKVDGSLGPVWRLWPYNQTRQILLSFLLLSRLVKHVHPLPVRLYGADNLVSNECCKPLTAPLRLVGVFYWRSLADLQLAQ